MAGVGLLSGPIAGSRGCENGDAPSSKKRGSLGLRSPGSRELLDPRGLELRGASHCFVDGFTHCGMAAHLLEGEAGSSKVGREEQ